MNFRNFGFLVLIFLFFFVFHRYGYAQAGPVVYPIITDAPLPTDLQCKSNCVTQGCCCTQTESCEIHCTGSGSCLGGTCHCTTLKVTVSTCTDWWCSGGCMVRDCGNDFQIRCPCGVDPTGPGGPTGGPAPTGGGGGGSTPTPTPASLGALTAIAKVVPYGTTDCQSIIDSTTYLHGTQFDTSPLTWALQKTQSYAQPAVWNPVGANIIYTVTPFYSGSGYVYSIACHNSTSSPSYVIGASGLLLPNDRLNFYFGYTTPGAFTQIQGGDMYGSSQIYSYLPAGLTPRTFIVDPAPGVLVYGTSFDFDTSGMDVGKTLVSSKNWQVQQTLGARNWYAIMSQRLADASSTAYDNGALSGGKPSMKEGETTSIYTYVGDITINSVWDIMDTDNLILQIEGNLNINNPITLTGANKTGAVVFLVSGNITVASGVGGLFSSSVPVVEGVYIAGGTFATGTSTNVGTERFVGKGTFVANGFTLQRDLNSVGHNDDTSAELFIENPMMYFSLPKVLQDLPYTWQEVAP